jgi:hypothetical protein
MLGRNGRTRNFGGEATLENFWESKRYSVSPLYARYRVLSVAAQLPLSRSPRLYPLRAACPVRIAQRPHLIPIIAEPVRYSSISWTGALAGKGS